MTDGRTDGRSVVQAIKQRRQTQAGTALSVEQRKDRNSLIDRLYEREGATLKEIGDLLGISGERVRQLRRARGKRSWRITP